MSGPEKPSVAGQGRIPDADTALAYHCVCLLRLGVAQLPRTRPSRPSIRPLSSPDPVAGDRSGAGRSSSAGGLAGGLAGVTLVRLSPGWAAGGVVTTGSAAGSV